MDEKLRYFKLMKINKKILKEKYQEYNRLYFNSELPYCDLRISSAYRYYGLFKCKIDEKYKKVTCKSITISDLYDYTEESLKNILIHEMIHYYLIIKKKLFKDSFSHGPEFKKMADEYNKKYNLNIKVTQDWGDIKLLPTTSKFLFKILNIF